MSNARVLAIHNAGIGTIVQSALGCSLILVIAVGCASEEQSDDRQPVEIRIEPFEHVVTVLEEVQLRTLEDDPIGRIADVIRFNDVVVVVDQMQANLKMFGLDGRLIRTVGAPGRGPGEFLSPRSAATDRAGRLAAIDISNSVVSLFGEGGEWYDSWSVEGFAASNITWIDEEHIVVHAQLPEGSAAHPMGAHLYDVGGNRKRSFHPIPEPTQVPEGSFQMQIGLVSDSIIVSGILRRPVLHFHDLRTDTEWTRDVGGTLYRKPAWRDAVDVRTPAEINSWSQQQMWMDNIVDGAGEYLMIGFVVWGPDINPSYQYVVTTVDGQPLVGTTETAYRIGFADSCEILATRMLEDGTVVLARMRVLEDVAGVRTECGDRGAGL